MSLSVEPPLDVHGRGLSPHFGIVFLDLFCPLREYHYLLRRNGKTMTVRLGSFDDLYRGRAAARRVYEFRLFAPEPPSDNRKRRLAQHLFCDEELIRHHLALHYHFAESVGRSDEDDVGKAALGIERKYDARGAEVGADHAL